MAEQLKPGDVVVMKSGGPKMTIAKIIGSVATCQWFNGPMQETGTFDLVMLEPAGKGGFA